MIHQCVNPNILDEIVDEETTKGPWDVLKNCYGGGDKLKKVKLQALRSQYELLYMTSLETVVEFFKRMITLTNQMESYGEKITNLMQIDKVLRTLTSNFDHIVVAIEESKDLEKM